MTRLAINGRAHTAVQATREHLPCDRCPHGAGGRHTRVADADTQPSVFCSIYPEVLQEKQYWIPLVIARACQGPDHLREKLVRAFMDEGRTDIPPPDS